MDRRGCVDAGEPFVAVDPDAEIAPYAQIFEQIRAAIDRGTLASGDLLPTVRQLAGDLAVAPNTVARAYADLQAAGLIQADGRRGTRVSHANPSATKHARVAVLQDAAARFVTSLSRRGYSRPEIGAALRRILADS